MVTEFLSHLLNLLLDTAVWLLFGLILAALLKIWIPPALIQRWLSGKGSGAVIRAALIGAPLPLCSCGVLPAAIGLHRSGASKPATVSFLVATPETGIDSISVTYALLGPVMAIIRPIAALISALVSGLLVLFLDTQTAPTPVTMPSAGTCCAANPSPHAETACGNTATKQPPTRQRLASGLRFAVVEILDDISGWLAIGLVLAALIATFVEPASLSDWGSGPSAMFIMLAAGLPLYICATASTPLAAALLAAGISPGAVLVFLLVGPATNIASIGILSRELGVRALALYLAGISSSAVILGLATDALLDSQTLMPGHAAILQNSAFQVIQWSAVIVLLVLAIKPIRQLFWPAEAADAA